MYICREREKLLPTNTDHQPEYASNIMEKCLQTSQVN
jgi:hypothetical protein